MYFSHFIGNFPFSIFESFIFLAHSICNSSFSGPSSPDSLVTVYFVFIIYFYTHVCFVLVPHACTAFRSQKSSLDPLGLELQSLRTAVWVLAIKPESFGRAASCSSPPSHLSSPQVAMFFSGPFLYLMTHKEPFIFCQI